MASKAPTIIDLNAQVAELAKFHRTPQPMRETRGKVERLTSYRDGMLLLGTSAGNKGHWETHPEDELLYILDGARTLDIVEKEGPQSYVVGAGMIVIVPVGAWHRVSSTDVGIVMSATLPGEHIDLDVDDPRAAKPEKVTTTGTPTIIDLDAELAKLTMFRGRTPQSTMADRKGSSARLAACRDGGLSITKFAGKGHWEAHLAGDELIYILDGTTTLDSLGDDGPRSFELRAGMIAVNRQGAWHRFRSLEGVALMAVTPSPSEVIELDVDDPRTVERAPA